MNIVLLVGRLSRDPESRTTNTGKAVTTFTIAVDRIFKQEGQPSADFIPCVLFGKTAEIAARYLQKGHRAGVTGRIQTRSYDAKDGSKRYVTEVIVDNLELLEPKPKSGEFGSHVPDEQIPF